MPDATEQTMQLWKAAGLAAIGLKLAEGGNDAAQSALFDLSRGDWVGAYASLEEAAALGADASKNFALAHATLGFAINEDAMEGDRSG